MLKLEIERKAFVGPGGAEAPPERTVLQDIRLEVETGQFLCILGPSGCGKTTLLNLIAGLDRDYSGTIDLPVRAGEAPRIGYVFQSPVLLPWRSVIENLHLVMSPEQIARGLAERLLEAVGLAGEGDAYPKSLSLGMSRRVSLARAFAVEPDLLLMDEPFVSLDEPTAQKLRGLLIELWCSKPTTVVFVTHDSREAVQLAQRIVVLSDKPARVLLDRPVDLTADQRVDPQAIEAIRAGLAVGQSSA